MSSKLAGMGSKGRKAFQGIENPHNRFNRNLERSNRTMTRTNSGMSSLLGLAGRLGLAFSFTQAVGGAIRLGAEFEGTKVAFETMLGSAEKGNKLIDRLFNFSNNSPFDFRSTQQAAETLLGFGVANEKVLPAMKMLGDVSRGNKERFKLMTLAYAQMQSAGKLMGQDLLQMINAGFNPLQYIAEETGESISVLRKKMEQGAISTSMVERAFKRATSQGGKFFNMMEKQSKTVSGKWQIFLGKLQIQTSKTMESIMPHFGKLLDWGINMVEYLPVLVSAMGRFFNSIKDSWIVRTLGNNIEWVTGAMVAYTAVNLSMAAGLRIANLWTKMMTISQWSLNAAFAANPVGFVILAIAALAAGFAYLYNQVGWVRGIVDGAWVAFKNFSRALGEYVIDRIGEVIKGLSGMGKALMHFFNGDWKKAWQVGKQAADDLNPFTGKAKKEFWRKAVTENMLLTQAQYEASKNEAKRNSGKSLFDTLGIKIPGMGGGDSAGATDPTSPTKDLTALTQNGAGAINGGGSRQTNITVTFDKLVENFTISSQNVSQGMAQSEEELKRMLLRVLNSMNQMQTSPV